MQFTTRKRRGTPTVIIVSLIDVLIVVLIFLMVTTTFKQQAALKLTLPVSNQPQTGATAADAIIDVSIDKRGLLYLDTSLDPVTYDVFLQRLKERAAGKPNLTLNIKADADAPWGQIVKVRDAAHEAKIKIVNAAVKPNGAR